jgi:FKBP-type peptidyl-prolyl cis-trans isomerase FkpA
MKNSIIIGLVAIVLLGGIWYVGRGAQMNNSNTNETANISQSMDTNTDGFKVEDVVVGTGDEAKAGDLVAVNYTGTLDNGTKFDSSYDHGNPIVFQLGSGQVIEGWDKGIAGMKVGGKRRLTIPPSMGYGDRTVGPIPANSILHFETELMGVQHPKAGE